MSTHDVLREGHECEPNGRNGHLVGAVITCRTCGAMYRAQAKKDDFGVTWFRMGLIPRWLFWRAERRRAARQTKANDRENKSRALTVVAPTAIADGPGSTASANVTITRHGCP